MADARHHRVCAQVWHGPMAALAFDINQDVFAGCHGGALAQQQLALPETRHVVHGKDGIAGEAVKQAVFHHLARAAQAFFGRLKNQIQRAIKRADVCKVLCRSQQHGGVPIVATRMHQARMATGMGQPGSFLNGQRIHVGTQTQLARTGAALELPHHTGATQTPRDA